MKNTLKVIIITLISLNFSLPLAKVDMDLKMGIFSPDTDQLVMQTFGKDFYWQGMLGLIDESGWEIRANVGHYTNISHNPADLGTNLRIGITPIIASLIYNIPVQNSVIKPYFGAGVGGYLFQLKDDILGELSSSTKFGTHILAGVRIDINEKSYLIGEYCKHFLGTYDSSSLIIGAGFYFPMDLSNSTQSKYKYSKYEEELLVDIQQAETEIKEMIKKRDQMQYDIDTFYKSSDYNSSDVQFTENYQKIKFMESKVEVIDKQIKEAKVNLAVLEKKWALEHQDNQPIENHIIYLQNNYGYSPYGLSYRNGFFRRNNAPFTNYNHYNDSNYNYQPTYTNTNTSDAVEVRKEYAEKKKKRLEELKSRGLL